MRKKLLDQLPLTPAPIDHVRATELAAISDLLDRLPEATSLIHEELSQRDGRRVDVTRGRDGMAAEQVLRVAILKQHTGMSYEAMAFGLLDSSTYRSFCRVGLGTDPPKKSTLQKNVKRIKAVTWEAVNRLVIREARELGVDDGKKIRTDCTVVESNIHHPSDSTLLGDCVRVLGRLMKRARRSFGLKFTNHGLRARRRVLNISNAKSMRARVPLYRDLLTVTEKVLQDAHRLEAQLASMKMPSVRKQAEAAAIMAEIRHYSPLVGQVLSQAERRVLRGESVPANEKIVSIFEPHADIILKGGREVEYGHKICLTTGNSSLVTDVVVEEGNPADSTMAVRAIRHHQELFGGPPLQASFDGGFATRENLADIKELGVRDVVFHKRCGIAMEEMTSCRARYKRLRAFRAGIEGTISFLKRVFGLNRCSWRSLESFHSYVHVSVLACNLLVVARHIIATRT